MTSRFFGALTPRILRSFIPAALLAPAALALTACQSPYPVSNAQALAQLANEPLETAPWHFGLENATQIKAGQYRIYTTIKDPLYQRLLAKLLLIVDRHNTLLNPTAHITQPLECYVFASRSQWESYTRAKGGPEASIYLQITSGGYCQRGVFAGYDIGREQTFSVIAHESWHQYAWFAYKDHLPSWIDEGLATQNESIDWEGTNPTFRPAMNWRRFSALRGAIHENRLWKLDDLVSKHAGQIIKLPENQVNSWYAQLWSLMLFLQTSPIYNPRVKTLLADASAGTLSKSLAGTPVTQHDIDNYTERWNTFAGPIYLQKYIAPDTASFEKEYTTWCRQLTATWPPKISSLK